MSWVDITCLFSFFFCILLGYTWEVKANDRVFNNSFTRKRFLFFTKQKYAVSYFVDVL